MLLKIQRLLARADVFTYACAWLIVLLVVGTLAQRDIGLYLAQEKYFSSWMVMFGPIPLPGGRLAMAVVFVSLAAYLAQRRIWTLSRSGILIAHLGAMLLLVGGFLTAYFSSEGSMLIHEGNSSNYYSDYHEKEIAFIGLGQPELDAVTVIREKLLEPGKEIAAAALPGTVEVLEYYDNCRVLRHGADPGEEYHGLAREYRLEGAGIASEAERNQAGALIRLKDASAADGIYLLVEDAARPVSFEASGESFQVVLRRKRTYLPFRLDLIDFEQQHHPGTRMARSYMSTLDLAEGDVRRRVVIQMNEPLRHAGFTFFQSSFLQGPTEATILAVVQNRGRLFPYIASLIMSVGLLVHLGVMLWRKPEDKLEGGEK